MLVSFDSRICQLRWARCIKDMTIKILGLNKKTKFYQASTSELYGMVKKLQMKTPFIQEAHMWRSYAYWITINYREAYDIFACNSILLILNLQEEEKLL